MVRLVTCLLSFLLLTAPSTSEELHENERKIPTVLALEGTVLQADGTLAAGAEVWAAALHSRPAQRVHGKTDAHGRFRLDLPQLSETPASPWVVRARLGNQGGEANGPWGLLDLWMGGQQISVTIRLEERGVVRGRVLQEENDRPIAAQLFLDTGEVVATDANGCFRIGGLPLKNHTVVAVAPGRVRRQTLFDTSNRPQAELEIRLARGVMVTGKVTDATGQPIPGAWLEFTGSGDILALHGCEQRCGPDGSFVIDGIDPHQRNWELSARAPGYQAVTRAVSLRPDMFVPPLMFLLPRKSSSATPAPTQRFVTGVVCSSAGKPVSGATVRWQAREGGRQRREVATDAQGRFTFHELPDTPLILLVLADGFAPQMWEVLPDTNEPRITLARGQSAEGYVHAPDGEPLKDVWVVPKLGSWSLGERAVKTDANGRYVLPHLPSQFRLVFHRADREGVETVVRLNDGLPEMVLQARGGVWGQVLDPDGKPVRNFRVRVQDPRKPPPVMGKVDAGIFVGYEDLGVSFTSDDGTFVLSDLTAGGWVRLIVTAPGFGQMIHDPVPILPLDSLPTRPLKFTLKPAYQCRVRLVDARNCQPLTCGIVTLLDEQPNLDGAAFFWGEDDYRGFSKRTDTAGWASWDKLAFAEATVIAECPGYARQRLGWQHGAKELTVQMKPEAVLEVEVKGVDFASMELASQDAQRYPAYAHSQNRHSIRFEQLPEGEYTLTVRSPRSSGTKPHQRAITLRPGDRQRITVELPAEHKP